MAMDGVGLEACGQTNVQQLQLLVRIHRQSALGICRKTEFLFFPCFPIVFQFFLVKTHSRTSGQHSWSFWTGLDLPRPDPTHFASNFRKNNPGKFKTIHENHKQIKEHPRKSEAVSALVPVDRPISAATTLGQNAPTNRSATASLGGAHCVTPLHPAGLIRNS